MLDPFAQRFSSSAVSVVSENVIHVCHSITKSYRSYPSHNTLQVPILLGISLRELVSLFVSRILLKNPSKQSNLASVKGLFKKCHLWHVLFFTILTCFCPRSKQCWCYKREWKARKTLKSQQNWSELCHKTGVCTGHAPFNTGNNPRCLGRRGTFIWLWREKQRRNSASSVVKKLTAIPTAVPTNLVHAWFKQMSAEIYM